MANAYSTGEKETRSWGGFEVLHTGDTHTCKVLWVKPHSCLSLQAHQYRAEHWVVVMGTATVQLDETVFEVPQHKHIFINKKQIHCLANNTDEDLILIEVQTGEILDETDITRYEQTKNLIRKAREKCLQGVK